jgi:hypothetical protein
MNHEHSHFHLDENKVTMTLIITVLCCVVAAITYLISAGLIHF